MPRPSILVLVTRDVPIAIITTARITPAADVTRTARMCLGLYKAGLELVLSHEGTEREAYIQELKKILIRYLTPMVAENRAWIQADIRAENRTPGDLTTPRTQPRPLTP